jgi:hypothetical protein
MPGHLANALSVARCRSWDRLRAGSSPKIFRGALSLSWGRDVRNLVSIFGEASVFLTGVLMQEGRVCFVFVWSAKFRFRELDQTKTESNLRKFLSLLLGGGIHRRHTNKL